MPPWTTGGGKDGPLLGILIMHTHWLAALNNSAMFHPSPRSMQALLPDYNENNVPKNKHFT
jgi:hypothetical protein